MNHRNLDNFCEKGILFLILSALIFSALATGAVRTMEFAIVQLLTAMAAILWIIRIWGDQKHKRLLLPPVAWVLFIFIIYAFYHYLNADVEYTARREVLKLLTYGMIFLVVMNNLYKSDCSQIIMFTLVITGALIAIYGSIQVIIGNFIEPKWVGNSMNISPLVSILSLMFWGLIWGTTGMIVSVPFTVVIIIILSEIEYTRPLAILLSEKGDINEKE